MTHWLLYLILTIPGAGYVTTDKIEGFTTQAQCERMASLLYSARNGVSITHFCLRVE